MDRKILRLALVIAVSLFVGTVFTGCNDGENASEPYLLKKEDIRVSQPEGGFAVVVDQLLKVRVESESDEGISYLWLLDGSEIARTKDLEYMFEEVGEYELILRASQGENHYDYLFTVTVTLIISNRLLKEQRLISLKFLILFRPWDNLLMRCRHMTKETHKRL